MNLAIRRFLKTGWIVLCIAVLMVTLVKFDHRPDSDISDFLIWSMLVLSVPSGILILLLNAGLAYFLHSAFSITISTTYLTLAVTWSLFFIVGYIQWFYALPLIVEKIRASTKG